MTGVDHRHVATIEAPRAAVFAVLAEVGTYDRWLDIVDRVEPDRACDRSDTPTPPAGDVARPAEERAWFFTLRARIGPFARSKRLRVVEAIAVAPDRIRLERAELDDRDHAPWTFDATLADGDTSGSTSTVLTLQLAYGGRLWTSALNPVLDNQLAIAVTELEALAVPHH